MAEGGGWGLGETPLRQAGDRAPSAAWSPIGPRGDQRGTEDPLVPTLWSQLQMPAPPPRSPLNPRASLLVPLQSLWHHLVVISGMAGCQAWDSGGC